VNNRLLVMLNDTKVAREVLATVFAILSGNFPNSVSTCETRRVRERNSRAHRCSYGIFCGEHKRDTKLRALRELTPDLQGIIPTSSALVGLISMLVNALFKQVYSR
jgi:hypothetical protein